MVRNCCGLFYLLLALLFLIPVAESAPPAVSADAAIVMDAKTGQVLYDKQSHNRGAPASTTKILTAIIAIESGRLDDEVKVSVKAAGTPGSSMHLYAGQIISMRELLAGLMLRSGNDAAVAIAEHLAGSVEAFAELMNHKARLLGAYDSHFRNPNGLSAAGHYTTAFDLAWITRYALLNPVFAEIVNTKETGIEWLDRSGHEHDRNLRNTNKLLWMFEDADGVKTGTTGEAGPCLVSSATRGNQKLIAVVLHDHSRWFDSMKLLKYGFDSFDLYQYAEEGDILSAIPVEQGLRDCIDAAVAGPAALAVSAEEYDAVTVELDLPGQIRAPVYKGQKIGEIVFYIRDKAVKTVDVVAAQDVDERTVTRTFFNQLLQTIRLLSGWGML
ncbi:MAG: D-alanyl-D-alanine carboxypeptidase family protein [Veillonellales bacterium]